MVRSNFFYCIMGPSGSGKTSLAEWLEENGMADGKQVVSYTTRKPRYDGEKGHIFITKKEFDQLGELCAYTKLYNGVEYGVTKDMLDQCVYYVIDPAGLQMLKRTYDRPIRVIGLYASDRILRQHMTNRGDSQASIDERRAEDSKIFTMENMENWCDILINAESLDETRNIAYGYIYDLENDDLVGEDNLPY